MKKLIIILLTTIFLFGCSPSDVPLDGEIGENEITQRLTPQVTKTSEATRTKSPTSKIIPTQTTTFTVTPEPYLGSVVISPENVSRIEKISNIGQGRTNTVAWSPDGKMIAYGNSEDNFVHLWDVEKKKEVLTLQGHSDSVHGLTFSPDGNLLASSNWVGRNVFLWDLRNGKKILSFEGLTLAEPQIAFSPDGSLFAYCGPGATVRIWDIENERELYQFGGHNNYVSGLAFSPDGNLLASSSEYSIMLWDMTKGALVDTLKLESSCWFCNRGPYAASLCFSPDGSKLASVIHISGGYSVEREGFIIWDIVNKEPLLNLQNDFENNVFKYYYDYVNFSPDGNLFILDWEIWSTLDMSLLTTLQIDALTPSVIFSPDGKTLAIPMYSSDEGGVALWGIP